MSKTLKENKARQKQRWLDKKERHGRLCKDMITQMLELTEEAHVQSKRNGKITKHNWAEWMKEFVEGKSLQK